MSVIAQDHVCRKTYRYACMWMGSQSLRLFCIFACISLIMLSGFHQCGDLSGASKEEDAGAIVLFLAAGPRGEITEENKAQENVSEQHRRADRSQENLLR